MSIKRRLNRLEDKAGPTKPDVEGLHELAAMLHPKGQRPKVNSTEDMFIQLKRIIPAPGRKIADKWKALLNNQVGCSLI